MTRFYRRPSPLRGLFMLGPLLLALPATTAVAQADATERRLVFGSYADPANASDAAAAIEAALGIETELVPVEAEGRQVVRVTSPVIVGDAIWPLTSRAAEARIDAWAWRVPED